MNPIDFIFMLIKKFVPIKEAEFASMKMEADAWHMKATNGEEEPTNPVMKAYKEHTTKWYVKLGLSVLWLFAVKAVADFMTETKDEINANGSKISDIW